MKTLLYFAALVGLLTVSGISATLSPHPAGSEKQFVHFATHALVTRYATPAAAQSAGYYRYNNEDETGAISYVNPAYWKSDLSHPSQLWYDVHGRLLGADYTIPMVDHPRKPSIWGVQPSRWSKFDAHVHWVLRLPDGAYKYGLATSDSKYKAAGGILEHITAAPIVKLGKATSTAEVAHIFAFPDLWDMEVWVVPNPSGAFANANPLVHASKRMGKGMP